MRLRPEPVCRFCGSVHDDARKVFCGTGVDGNGRIFESGICSVCIGLVMSLVAYDDRETFEKMVEEARAFRFPSSEET